MNEYIIKEGLINTLIGLAEPNGFSISFIGEVVSAPEIVRCRDCKHRFGCVHLIEVQQEDGDGDMIRCETSPDCYCSWGERA